MPQPLHLFEAFGIEVETMIVGEDDLNVAALAEGFLARAAGLPGASDAAWGQVTLSNELVAHVIELKSTRPEPGFAVVGRAFADAANRADALLGEWGARLLPGGAHPWMDPARETVLWSGDYADVYETYHRIFDCRQHGWANLQSCHLNLPFRGDDEFGRLHAAVRLILPLLPALCASTPYLDGRRTRFVDARLDAYRRNQARYPAIAGEVIPEPVFTEEDYRDRVLGEVRRAVAEIDPDGVLEADFLNSRGAIARFDRGSIELRLMDAQECPRADVALCALVVAVLRELVGERWSATADQMAVATRPLVAVLDAAVIAAERALIADTDYLRHFGIDEPMTAGELWRGLGDRVGAELGDVSRTIVEAGSLGRRIVSAVEARGLETSYRMLADCLRSNTLFLP